MSSSLSPAVVPLDPYSEIVARTSAQHRLFSVHWELTYRCNERCSHCYLNVLAPDYDSQEELTTAECLKVVDDLAELGVLNLTLSGGELLVRRDWLEIARHAHERRFLLRLFTNGIAVTPSIADQIAELHPFVVELSLYSVHPDVHDKITRRFRSHELTLRALRLLRERGVRTLVKTPLMHENIRELHLLEQLARDFGAQFRYDLTLTPKDNGDKSPLRHRPTDQDLHWFFHETLDPEFWITRTIASSDRTCNIARNAILIDPWGNVLSCVQLRATAGNVRNQPVKRIWEQAPLWQELGNLTLEVLPFCTTCELRALCFRCHGLAQLEAGDLRGRASINCREALIRRQVLIEKGALPASYPVPLHLRQEMDITAAGLGQ